jgi:hypothetical protein
MKRQSPEEWTVAELRLLDDHALIELAQTVAALARRIKADATRRGVWGKLKGSN